ncbi:MAG: tautomerase family protein [Verrucomicrobia bacterium]|nr:tautomerase family protein [Verrucomicrobiota bacterium]
MPLVRISLLKGKSNDHIRTIADSVHQALVETFEVPADDRFQFIDQYEPEEFIYDPNYLGIHRSRDVVFINITFSNWRDTAAKQQLYKRLAELLSANAGLRLEDVQVILSPNAREDWSFGNGLASYVKDEKREELGARI